MTKIYTRTGDNGETGLWGGARVPKHHPRVAAYGEVDELNCALGAALAALAADERLARLQPRLETIQRELFVVGALLATPGDKLSALAPPFNRGLPADAAKRLESEIDSMDEDLSPLKSFILPGGCPAGAALHLARAVCRRAERAVTAMAQSDAVPEGLAVYMNRLSDHLFTAARWANARAGSSETPWQGLEKR